MFQQLDGRRGDKLTLHNVWLVICAKRDLQRARTSVCVRVFTISTGLCLKSKHLSSRFAVTDLKT